MIGCGEIFFPAFVLALGLGPVAAGLIPSLSILIAAIVQLITPTAVNRLGSNRLWVIGCTTIQSVSFLPLIFWAIQGKASFFQLLVITSIYWSAGMAGVPAWNTWMGILIPAQIRAAYFAQRNRLAHLATLIGFLFGRPRSSGCRTIRHRSSCICLSFCSGIGQSNNFNALSPRMSRSFTETA